MVGDWGLSIVLQHGAVGNLSCDGCASWKRTALAGLGFGFGFFLRVPWALSEVGGVRTAAVRAFEIRWGIEGFDAFVRVVVPSAFHAPGFKVAVGTAMAELQAVVALGSPQSVVSLPSYRDSAEGWDFSDFSKILGLCKFAKKGRRGFLWGSTKFVHILDVRGDLLDEIKDFLGFEVGGGLDDQFFQLCSRGSMAEMGHLCVDHESFDCYMILVACGVHFGTAIREEPNSGFSLADFLYLVGKEAKLDWSIGDFDWGRIELVSRKGRLCSGLANLFGLGFLGLWVCGGWHRGGRVRSFV